MTHSSLRVMSRNDIPVLAQVYAQTYACMNVDEEWTVETAQRTLEYQFNLQPDLAFLAEVDGTIAGAFLCAVKPWWDGNHLYDGELFVHPNFQKQGIGKQLIKHLFGIALEKYQVIDWACHTFSKREFPLAWYKKLGFKEVESLIYISANVQQVLQTLK